MKFQVQLWPAAKLGGNRYETVEADNAKEAAETLYGKPLKEWGSNLQRRAHVHPLIWPRGDAIFFYELEVTAAAG